MARRILTGLIVIGLIGAATFGYRRWSQNRSMAAGDVFGDPGTDTTTAAAPPPTPTPKPAPAQPTPYSAVAAPATPDRNPAPATDSINPNPPNGDKFAGAGRYQLYRQGNLTWRLDTDTGQTCVLLATHEEWRKPEVYRYGCNTRPTR